MNMKTSPSSEKRLGLKEPGGWFAAGRSFQQAIGILSDGAFKLFAYVCLQADRHTGQLQVTHKQLAGALGKSKRAIGSYIEELQRQGMCVVLHGRNQYAPSWLQITDQYWPYHRPQAAAVPERSRYVSAIREAFLDSGCSIGRFGPADLRTAKALERRGVPLSAVLDAILVGSCRKYISWLNGGTPEVIGSLQYFEQLIAEVSEQPLAEDYRQYLRAKNQQLAENWSRRLLPQRQPQNRQYSDMADTEVVQ
jgi:hypothetical protein